MIDTLVYLMMSFMFMSYGRMMNSDESTGRSLSKVIL